MFFDLNTIIYGQYNSKLNEMHLTLSSFIRFNLKRKGHQIENDVHIQDLYSYSFYYYAWIDIESELFFRTIVSPKQNQSIEKELKPIYESMRCY